MTFILRNLIICFCLVLLFTSCTTDDILPTIELSSSNTNLSEANGTITITASVNTTLDKDLSVPLILSGTANESSDFSLSASTIIISTSSSSGSITITGIQDDIVEGVETLNVALGTVPGVLVLTNTVIAISVLDDDTDSDGDGVLDANDNCVDVPGDIENDGCPYLGFLINEVLYDPAADLPGDANGDGIRDPNDDEFVEFYNSGPALDISGYTVSDATTLRHTFPSGTIVPKNGVLVLFGGGNPTGSFGGAIVQTASEGQINISNAGDIITVRDAIGNVVVIFDLVTLSGNPDESYTRNPDLTGNFEQHASIPNAEGRLFSPGTKLDGSSFFN